MTRLAKRALRIISQACALCGALSCPQRLCCAVLCAGLLVWSPAHANNIAIGNLVVHPYSGGNGEVEFDVSWDNSWRVSTEPHNWDAAWIFCKIRRNGGDWAHLKLNTTGHTIPSTPQAITTSIGLADTGAAHNASTNPAVGIFMYRADDGFGSFFANDVRLQWSYADNGAQAGDAVEIRVFAIEMVYTPEAPFYAGDFAGASAAFRQGSADTDPWYITSENAISVTDAVSDGFYYVSSGWVTGESETGASFTIPAAFPKGYGAFYMMKGELSQSQWVAFFNTLTNTQKSTRDITNGVNTGKNSDDLVNRNNVSWTSGEATLPDRGGGATYAGVAMNFISWGELAAYLDWAGLRPMSELEFEKAARGTRVPVSQEYAWGTTSISLSWNVSNGGLPSERPQVGSNAVCMPTTISGPVRVGSFARPGVTRQAAGAGFYGAMELSGNLWERAVSVGRTDGRLMEGRYHGNGSLDSSGDANVSTWQGVHWGLGFRGGRWIDSVGHAQVSNRSNATIGHTNRLSSFGGRGVRSAP